MLGVTERPAPIVVVQQLVLPYSGANEPDRYSLLGRPGDLATLILSRFEPLLMRTCQSTCPFF